MCLWMQSSFSTRASACISDNNQKEISTHTFNFMMIGLPLLAVFLPAAATVQGRLLIEASRDFPLGSEVENLALRPSGSVLATVYTSPPQGIYEVAPHQNSTPKLLYTFTNTTGACGITASPTEPDVFFVMTGNFSFDTLSPAPGSYAIHRLSFDKKCGDKPIVKKIAALGAIAQPNGITSVPKSSYLLIADSVGGFVYRFDTLTLQLTTYFDHPLLKPLPGPIRFGVNGVKLSRGYMYFSNTNQQIVARIKATGREETVPLTGNPETVATSTPVDDFIVNDLNGDVYLAEQDPINGIGLVSKNAYGSVPVTIASGPPLLGPTAAIWAKCAVGKTLLVSVTGGFEQFVTKNFTGGGKVVVVHLE
ncbi:hypothetical protein B0H66DRAFT_570984 [Apodospora peruviana]|uniref:NHL repeat-containing protein n=1 Tax=Apodospora peruviana TaxID=516989 RepID=A0AAE0HS92_9PEZI|nr:hypothetical protein B0H66DRAFT_570984 [Apodospora peruviana]